MRGLESILQKYGLSGRAATLYLAALQTGNAPLSAIAKRAKINRSTAYQVVKELERSALMSRYQRRGVLYFAPAAPETLLERSERHLTELTRAMPRLSAIFRKDDGTTAVSYFEGEQGYLHVLYESLKVEGATLCHLGAIGGRWEAMGKLEGLKDYISERVKKRIRLRALYYPDDSKSSFNLATDPKELREVRYLPQRYYHPSSRLIFKGKVAFFTLSSDQYFSVLVESREIAESERKLFELLWEVSSSEM